MRTLAIMFAAIAFALPAAASAADSVTGKWITHDGKAVVTIGHCGTNVCGKITKILAPTPDGPPHDDKNDDPALRDRPLLGLKILSGFRPDGDEWKGHVYSPDRGDTYRSVLKRKGAKLEVKGCVALFCKSELWRPAT